MKLQCPNGNMMLPITRKLTPLSRFGQRDAGCPACGSTVRIAYVTASPRNPRGHYYTPHVVDEVMV